MSLWDYEVSKRIILSDPEPSFASLIMAAMRKADTVNMAKLRAAFPDTYREVEARYNAPGGVLAEDGIR